MSHRVVAASAAAVLISSGSSLPAEAAEGEYVALGDSFSAGVGTRDRQDDCYRSPYGYPALIAGQHGLALNYQACGSATTADVRSEQVSALSGTTSLVSMTIGGNDAGFTEVIVECALPAWASDCTGAINDGLAVINGELPGSYDDLFADIAAAAPQAQVAIGGYPLLFNGEDCNLATFFSPDEEALLNGATETLNDLIDDKTTSHGFTFVNAEPTFAGHAVCDDDEWINGLSDPVGESYHPNRAGNVGYAAIFSAALTGEPYAPTTGPQPVRAPVSIRSQADLVLAMDLDSADRLAAAEAHGIDPQRIKRLTEQLRSPDPDAVEQALRSMQQLDRRAA